MDPLSLAAFAAIIFVFTLTPALLVRRWRGRRAGLSTAGAVLGVVALVLVVGLPLPGAAQRHRMVDLWDTKAGIEALNGRSATWRVPTPEDPICVAIEYERPLPDPKVDLLRSRVVIADGTVLPDDVLRAVGIDPVHVAFVGDAKFPTETCLVNG